MMSFLRTRHHATILFTLLTLLSGLASARSGYIPPELEPWVDWVKTDDCPLVSGAEPAQRKCVISGRLRLSRNDKALAFDFRTEVYAPRLVALPGGHAQWPNLVRVNGDLAAVIDRQGVPSLQLSPGKYEISGSFAISATASGLSVPADIALIDYRSDTDAQLPAFIDAEGRVVFDRVPTDPEALRINEQNSLNLRIFRLIEDGIPNTVTTRIQLDVTGKPREHRLPANVFLPDTRHFQLSSDISASVTANGINLILQPGKHELTLQSVFQGQPSSWRNRGTAEDGSLPEFEFWSVQRHPELHTTEVTMGEGAFSADASISEIPQPWRSLPSYKVIADGELVVSRSASGMSESIETNIHGQRSIWLSFDAKTLFTKDGLSGEIPSGQTLMTDANAGLQSVLNAGEPQIIAMSEQGKGVEIKGNAVDHTFMFERVLPSATKLNLDPNVYNQAMKQVRGNLVLPPGYAVLHADSALGMSDYVSRWNNVSLFLLMLIVAGFYRLFNPLWAGLALVTMLLVYQQPDAPKSVLLVLLALVALNRARLGNYPRIESTLKMVYRAVFGLFVLIIANYCFNHFQAAVHPQLSLNTAYQDLQYASNVAFSDQSKTVREEYAVAMPAPSAAMVEYRKDDASDPRPDSKALVLQAENETRPLGSATPAWAANIYPFSWNSASLAPHAAPAQVILAPPAATIIYNITTPFLLILLALAFLKPLGVRLPKRLLLGAAIVVMPSLSQSAAIPDAALLKELSERVNATPDCLPDCASIAGFTLDLDANGRLTLRVNTAAVMDQVAPLLRQSSGILWTQLDRTGEPVMALRDGSVIAALIPAGLSESVFIGALTHDEAVVSFHSPVHSQSITVSEHWSINLNQREGATLGFSLKRKKADTDAQTPMSIPTSDLDDMFTIERSLKLGADWSLTTRVSRSGSRRTDLSLTLLQGERIQQADKGLARNGEQVSLNFGEGVEALSWTSTIEPVPKMTLPPAPQNSRAMVNLDYSNIWRLDVSGGVLDHTTGSARKRWHQWPGEGMTFNVERTRIAQGESLVLSSGTLSFAPASDDGQPAEQFVAGAGSLTLAIQTSQPHVLVVNADKGVRFDRVLLNGNPVNLTSTPSVRVPLDIGAFTLTADFSLAEGHALSYAPPQFTFANGESAITPFNMTVQVVVPKDRFVIWASGDGFGPAVLFWSIVAGLVLGALILGKIGVGEISAAAWFVVLLAMCQTTQYAHPMIGLGFALVIVTWLSITRKRMAVDTAWALANRGKFNARQAGYAALTLLILLLIPAVMGGGLLGQPDFLVRGPGSFGNTLSWFIDKGVPEVRSVAAPVWLYRLLVLVWSLWFASILIKWLRAAWLAYSSGGILWVAKPPKAPKPQD